MGPFNKASKFAKTCMLNIVIIIIVVIILVIIVIVIVIVIILAFLESLIYSTSMPHKPAQTITISQSSRSTLSKSSIFFSIVSFEAVSTQT